MMPRRGDPSPSPGPDDLDSSLLRECCGWAEGLQGGQGKKRKKRRRREREGREGEGGTGFSVGTGGYYDMAMNLPESCPRSRVARTGPGGAAQSQPGSLPHLSSHPRNSISFH